MLGTLERTAERASGVALLARSVSHGRIESTVESQDGALGAARWHAGESGNRRRDAQSMSRPFNGTAARDSMRNGPVSVGALGGMAEAGRDGDVGKGIGVQF
jgi:hypothetical protein